mgnify:CR=1 FL=1
MLEFELKEDYIELIKLLKVLQIAENGAMAKTLVENGEVVRNGEPECRKRAKIRKGEVINVLGQTIKVIRSGVNTFQAFLLSLPDNILSIPR